MRLHKTAKVGLVLLVGLSLAATGACGKKNKTTGPSGNSEFNTAGMDEQKNAKKGGILKVIGQGDVSNLDPATSYEVIAWGFVMRGTTRQLMAYPNAAEKDARDTPIPDIASAAPEVSSDGLTYTFKLKPDVKYAPPINRAVAAGDFIREFKRLCDPNNPSGGLTYFTTTLVGLTEFCGESPDEEKGTKGKGLLGVEAGKANLVADYIEKTNFAGAAAPDATTLVLKLKKPAGDFLNLLSTSFASPVPKESLAYLADSPEFRQHFPSSGPYKIDSYKADEFIKIRRNENQPNGDAIRHANVDGIDITTNAANDVTQQQQIEGGAQDLYFGGEPPTEAIQRLKSDARLHIEQQDGCISYMVFNFKRNTPGGKALQKKEVRQAINTAVDKQGFLSVVGGDAYGTPTGQILTGPILGYKKNDPYATDGSAGDAAKAKDMLAKAGYPNGLDLTFIYRPARKGEAVFVQLRDNLKNAGIRLKPLKVPDKDYYGKHISDPAVNDWDMTAPAWCPDWNGNGARTFFLPLLDGRSFGKGTTNYGGYNNDAVNAQVDEALAESDPDKVAEKWAAIDAAVMDDAPWVPLAERNAIIMTSSRVKGRVFFPFSASVDVANVYLDPQ